MTNTILNDVRELKIDELEAVSGGGDIGGFLAGALAAAAGVLTKTINAVEADINHKQA